MRHVGSACRLADTRTEIAPTAFRASGHSTITHYTPVWYVVRLRANINVHPPSNRGIVVFSRHIEWTVLIRRWPPEALPQRPRAIDTVFECRGTPVKARTLRGSQRTMRRSPRVPAQASSSPFASATRAVSPTAHDRSCHYEHGWIRRGAPLYDARWTARLPCSRLNASTRSP